MEFDIIDLIKYYFKNIIIIAIFLFVSLIISMFYVANVYKAEYIGKTTIMLGINELNEDKELNIYFNNEVVKNYISLMKSEKVLKNAIELSNLDYEIQDLKNKVNIYNENNTQYITIDVILEDSRDCQILSYNIYKSLLEEAERIFNINNIHLIDHNIEGELVHNRFYYVIIFLFIGSFLSVIFLTIKFLFFYDLDLFNYFKKKYKVNNKNINKKINNVKRKKRK